MIRILTEARDFFSPDYCVVCRSPLLMNEEYVCIKCSCNLPYAGKIPPYQAVKGSAYGRNRAVNVSAFLYYDKSYEVKDIVHSFKYYENPELAAGMGRMAANNLKHVYDFRSADLIAPIPIHPGRIRFRGYNQTEYLCNGISSVWNIPVDAGLVARTLVTRTQTIKKFFERKDNMESAFSLRYTDKLAGKHIIVVDDVLTSGSTLASCADLLCTLPDIKVSLLAFAATQVL